ncbi:dTDP-glucose 4,6-dehydratase [Candidatus Fermentibacteria bacterium]|nr:MAG: dTDP-glucose 4,6-dehydratase [Candidatus Fermentibacteria bacterium]
MRLLVTGGAGFIGSNFCHYITENRKDWSITVLDKLTYAGRLENLETIPRGNRFRFVQGDICSPEAAAEAMSGCDVVVNFAAETHVDRSIDDPSSFVRTDIEGVRILLEEFRREPGRRLFLQISTDEVYGSVEAGRSKESDALEPRSPYSASKAGGELLAMSYFTTFGVPVAVTRASNNYGPFQYPEKLIPLFITNVFQGENLPLYGDGGNIRDWLFVTDHCSALEAVIEKGKPGRIYNIGAGQGKTNLEVTTAILEATGASSDMIRRIEDRPGHDRRYALDISRITDELKWKPEVSFDQGIKRTVKWYTENREWWQSIRSGEFMEYYRRMYEERLQISEGTEGK